MDSGYANRYATQSCTHSSTILIVPLHTLEHDLRHQTPPLRPRALTSRSRGHHRPHSSHLASRCCLKKRNHLTRLPDRPPLILEVRLERALSSSANPPQGAYVLPPVARILDDKTLVGRASSFTVADAWSIRSLLCEERGENARPGAVTEPAHVAVVDGVPGGEVCGYLAPTGPGALHPEDAVEQRPGRPAPLAPGWRRGQGRGQLLPRRRREGREAGHGDGWWPRRLRRRGGVGAARAVTPLGRRLVPPSPARPAWAARVQQAAHLRHRQRDQAVLAPFSVAAAVARAATRAACASRLRVTWRYQPAQRRTS